MAEPIAEVGSLAGICGHDGTDWEKVLIDASKRLVVAVAALSGTVEVVQDTPGDLLVGNHQYDGTVWRKSNLLWGYNDVWDENLGGVATGTEWEESTSTIPAGEIWVLQAVSIRNNTRAGGITLLVVERASGSTVCLAYAATSAIYTPLLATGQFTLQAGDTVTAFMAGIQVSDVIQAGVVGYKMKINM